MSQNRRSHRESSFDWTQIGLRSPSLFAHALSGGLFPNANYLYSVLYTEKQQKCILNQVLQSLWHHPKSPKLLCSRPKHSEAYLTTRKLLFSK